MCPCVFVYCTYIVCVSVFVCMYGMCVLGVYICLCATRATERLLFVVTSFFLCSSGWLRIHYVVQAGLELTEIYSPWP